MGSRKVLLLFCCSVAAVTIASARVCHHEEPTTSETEMSSTSTTASPPPVPRVNPASTSTVPPPAAPTRRRASSTTVRTREVDGEGSQPDKPTSDWGHNKKLVCYLGSWAVYRPGRGKYSIEDIDPFLCTHLIYGFTGLGHDNKIRSLDPWQDLYDNYGKGGFERFTNLKKQNPNLKTLIAIGGWNEGSIKYSNMASSADSRRVFIDSVVAFLEKYNFDGLDMDWEYPAARGGKPEDKNNFSALLRELKAAFAPKGYLLTAAVSAGKWFIEPAYDIPDVSQSLDLINVMAYDYHGSWEDKTGHNETGGDRISNVNYSINYWVSKGAPREKIVLGMGSYGRSFTLQRDSVNGLGAPAPQKGQAGPYTREPGSLGYNEICEAFAREQWTVVRDPYHLAPYAYKERQWVGYDDLESITVKTRYLNAMNLGGAMVWSLETDDFQGDCHGEKYPLLKTINRVLAEKNSELPTPAPQPAEEDEDYEGEASRGSSSSTASWERPSSSSSTTPWWTPSSSSTTESPSWEREHTSSSTTRKPASTLKPDADGNPQGCTSAGMFRHPSDCRKFYQCVDDDGGKFRRYDYDCPADTVFDTNSNLCVWPQSVPECSNYVN